MKEYYLIDMNLPGFNVPQKISVRPPSQAEQEKYRKDLNAWRSVKDAPEETKPVAPETTIVPNAAVTHDILKTALKMAVPEGSPEVLRRLQKIHRLIEDGLQNGGQMKLSKEDHRFLQSKYAKADKWNTDSDVCDIVIEVQNAISRAAWVTTVAEVKDQ